LILDSLVGALKHVRDQVAPRLPDHVRAGLRRGAGVNSAGFDPWGLNPDTAEEALRWGAWIYRHYFRVEARGIEKVPAGRVLIVPNHSGQLPFDGFFVAMAMALEADPPRLVRGMVERWFPALPFISTLFTRCGQVVGDPENCKELLRRDQAIMVFPEGVGGSGKVWWKRYQLQQFGTGFVRLALETGAPIVPVGVVGAEETYPSVYNWEWLARRMGTPYVPITPFFPLLGPLGMVPLPVKVQLFFGEPIQLEGDPDAPDEEIQGSVDQVKTAIRGLIEQGLEERPMLRALDRFSAMVE
jgi:1-acyl-sn-glycerol-3-phosphate acyltransferase